MGYQSIKGITVKPVNINKFNNWEAGEAFGGWIYDCSVTIGFSKSPTTIEISVALDTQTSSVTDPVQHDFDITKEDLFVNNKGNDEHYNITIGETTYEYMYPVSYKINVGSDSKSLSVKFIDYSVILDKTVINLFKKGGYDRNKIKHFLVSPEVSAFCQSCDLQTAEFNQIATNRVDSRVRASFVFYNHSNANGLDLIPEMESEKSMMTLYYDRSTGKFIPVDGAGVVKLGLMDSLVTYFNYATPLLYSNFNSTILSAGFNNVLIEADINGGSLTIGIEEWSDKICDNDGKSSYNFSELLLCLKRIGFKFSKVNTEDILNSYADVNGPIDKNVNYRKDYVGNLREVLTQWCADFGLDFYFIGKTLHFVDLSKISNKKLAQDIQDIKNIVYPNEKLGKEFNSDKNFAISNWSESADLEGTFAKSLVTFQRNSFNVKDSSKSSQRVWNSTTLHPLDFINFNGNTYDGRHVDDIDMCAALIYYSEDLRNIYASNLICSNPYNRGNYRAFAFFPVEVLDEDTEQELKNVLIKSAKDKTNSANKKNYEIESSHFDVIIGFHNPKEFEKIKQWEQALAENMYKYSVSSPPDPTNTSFDSTFFSSRVNFESSPDSEFFRSAKSNKIDLSKIFQINNVNNSMSRLYGRRIGIIPENSWFPSIQDFESQIRNNMARAGLHSCKNIFKSSGASADAQNLDMVDWTPKIEILSESSILTNRSWIEHALQNSGVQNGALKDIKNVLENRSNAENCPVLYYMIIPRVSHNLSNRNNHFVVKFNRIGGLTNQAMAQNEAKQKADAFDSNAKTLPKDDCESNILDRICESRGHFPCGQNDLKNRRVGFGNFNCRGVQLQFYINYFHDAPRADPAMNNVVVPGEIIPREAKGELYPNFLRFDFSPPIIQYPVFGTYYGVGTFNIETKRKNQETVQVHGSYWSGKDNVRKVEHLNNETPQELNTFLNPTSQAFFTPQYDINNNLIRSVSDYHKSIQGLTQFSGPEYSETIDFSIVGDPKLVSTLNQYLKPHRGLKSLSFKLSSEGFSADLQFSNAPAEMPKNEAILNKIIQKL